MTSFEKVIDRATLLFKDYRLDKLYDKNVDAFMTYMRGQLLNSIDDFSTSCLSDLSYHIELEEDKDNIVYDEDGNEQYAQKEVYYFDQDLASKEIKILALGILINWSVQNINDITEMNLHTQGRNFKAYSEANNMTRKQEILDKLREQQSRDIEEYQLGQLSKLPFFGE